jgi:carbon-monoxide dehydrogenase large subunit
VKGLGTYVDDVKLPDMLHLAFKRSDVAHGNIRSVDTSAAESMPGVELVMTGAQLAEILPPMPVATPFPAPDHHAITPDKVRYVGEPVAVVVATDRYLARDAADAIVVDIEELPAVVDPEKAMEGNPAIIHDDFENNLAVPFAPAGTGVNPETLEIEDESAITQAFERADVVISQRIVNQRLVPNAIETRGVVAHFEPGKDELTVWSTTQNPHIARTLISAVLGLGQHQVRVIAPDVGGGFGSKINVYGEDFAAASISRVLGKPVKWIEDRSEAFMTTTHGRDVIGYVDLAATNEGKVLGIKVRLIADIGAYEMVLTAAIPTLTAFMLSGVYDIAAVRSDLTEVFTNKMPTDAYRGAGRPEGIFFVERAMDILAQTLKLDPAELRRRNFIQPEQFPFTTAGGMVYDSGEYERALDKALENAGWDQMKADREAARAEGRVVGIGLSFYTEICGFGPSAAMPAIGLWEHASVTIERDGKVRATTGASSHGQGHETTFAQILADEFGVPMEDIAIVHGDTAQVRAGTGTFGSRSLAVGGTALLNATAKVKDKMRRFGAQLMELQPDDLGFSDGMIGPRGAEDTGIPFAEVAAFAYIPIPLPPDMEPGLSEEAFWEPEGFTWPFGCYISQVEIDRDTGELELQRFIGVDDCGNIINPLIVAGQIHGGIAQGVGQAMIEEAVYDEDGQLITGSFMDYAMPRARDFPRFELDHTVTPSPLNPMGAKGIGEAGTIGSTPCIANAVVDALSPFGVQHIDMMLRPEKLWQAMQGGQS